jgi:ubiquinone/menaquinone biosynthesis C-methylase UbiE
MPIIAARARRARKRVVRMRAKLRDMFFPSTPNQYYGELAQTYVGRRTRTVKWHREQSLMQELLNNVPDGTSVLDVPFGTGRFVEMYARKNMDIYGVEISRDMVGAAETLLGPELFGRCKIEIASAEAIPFESDRFDVVVCCRFMSMTTLEMARNVLSEFHRVAKDKVLLYMNVRKPNVWLLSAADRLLGLLGRPPAFHQRLGGNIEDSDFLVLLDQSGFGVVDRCVINDGKENMYLYYILTKRELS